MTLFGKNLIQLKKKSKLDKFTNGCVTRIGINCLFALKQLHEIGYIHRDVKYLN